MTHGQTQRAKPTAAAIESPLLVSAAQPSPAPRRRGGLLRRLRALAVGAAAFTLAVLVLSSEAFATSGDCSAPPPPAAAAAGYSELLFCDDFSSIATIDMDAAGCPARGKGPCASGPRAGYKWFRAGKPFNSQETAKSDIDVHDGVLTISGQTANMGILTTYWRDAGGFGGFSVKNKGAYFEAAIAFDPPPGNWLAQSRSKGGKPEKWRPGWPSFWTMDTCHLYGQCSPYMELDFFEYLSYNFVGTDSYSGSLHRWLDLNLLSVPCKGGKDTPKCHQKEQSNNWSPLKTGFLGGRGLGANNIIRVPSNTDWTQLNVAGMLLKQGDGLHYFFNDKAYNRNSYADFPWLSIADHGDYPLILGSEGWPMRVDWVRVWGKPQR